jgi:hypothetical protein
VKPKTVAVAPATGAEVVKEKCGRKALAVWHFLQDQEVCKRSGGKGAISHTPETIAKAIDMDEGTVIGACIALMRNGFACMAGEQKIRAA